MIDIRKKPFSSYNVPSSIVSSDIDFNVVGAMLLVELFEVLDCVVVDGFGPLSGRFITPTNPKLLGGCRKSLQLVSPIGLSWP